MYMVKTKYLQLKEDKLTLLPDAKKRNSRNVYSMNLGRQSILEMYHNIAFICQDFFTQSMYPSFMPIYLIRKFKS